MPKSFEDEFPNEPFSPTAVGSTGSTGPFGGYVAPGNIFTPIPVGVREPHYGSVIPFPQGKSYDEVVRESAPYWPPGASGPADDPTVLGLPHKPTDWEAIDAYWDATAEMPRSEVLRPPANIEVIDPNVGGSETVFETSSGVAGVDVSFWDTVGDIFTTTAPGAIQAYGTGQGWWGTPTTTPAAAFAPSGPGYYTGAASVLGKAAGNTAPPPIARTTPMATGPNCEPPANARYLRYNCQTGEYSKIPRRRRRRLLTSGDLKDLAALKSIVGGGDKMNGAVVAAIRR